MVRSFIHSSRVPSYRLLSWVRIRVLPSDWPTIRAGKYHDIFINIGYFRYISDVFNKYHLIDIFDINDEIRRLQVQTV